MARRAQPEPVDARLLKIAAAHIRRHGIAKTTIVSIAAEAHVACQCLPLFPVEMGAV